MPNLAKLANVGMVVACDSHWARPGITHIVDYSVYMPHITNSDKNIMPIIYLTFGGCMVRIME